MLSLYGLEKTVSGLGPSESVELNGLTRTVKGLLAASLSSKINRPLAVVLDKASKAEEFVEILNFFNARGPSSANQVLYFPAWEILPFEEMSPHPEISGQRIVTLTRLLKQKEPFILVTSIEALARKIAPRNIIERSLLKIDAGDSMDTEILADHLVSHGYRRAGLVRERGEFSIRGNIVDIYGGFSDDPCRIELFGDEVESIRLFNADTQRSSGSINQVEIIPYREVFYEGSNPEDIAEEFLEISTDSEGGVQTRSRIYELLRSSIYFSGMEAYLPLFFKHSQTLFDYLPEDTAFIVDEPEAVSEHLEEFMEMAEERHNSFVDSGRGDLDFEKLFISTDALTTRLKEKTIIQLGELAMSGGEGETLTISTLTPKRYKGDLADFRKDLDKILSDGNTVVLISATDTGAQRLSRLLAENEFGARIIDRNDRASLLEHMLDSQPTLFEGNLFILSGSLPEGLLMPRDKWAFITEDEIFGRVQKIRRRKRARSKAFTAGMAELETGDIVVHRSHGVGKYIGAKEMIIADSTDEYLEIEYAERQRLFVPMRDLDLVTKFLGGGEVNPPLDKMGGSTWKKTKAKVKKSLLQMADKLLKIYAARELTDGNSFSPDGAFHSEFSDTFEFVETEDQLAAILDVSADMESSKSMDRLVCGDVGYGKTEVAMRAAFKAVFDGKQVAVLVPTTLLAQQHYQTFTERFKSFPVKVQSLSRFKSRKEQKETIELATKGDMDVLIGTHRLLQKDINFKNLGLIIIDEEQRFGVKHKEKLRSMRQSVDVLTLTATPIPRTLHTALLGIRDLSVIETPPPDRQSIQTHIVKFSENIIKEAILRELDRGGQIFFLHNKVSSIHSIAEFLKKIIPQAKVAVAHGQMPERELETVMVDFIDRRYDVLVCTTIIESGLDIASSNTILINRADHFGLAQLYQLRGRVGRDRHRAFCYLLIPGLTSITDLARKRLKAIEELSELGSGFKLAARDMEIRGGGNLLGPEQSGQIAAVGFDTYCDMLEDTIKELKGEPVERRIDMDFNLNIQGRISPDYVPELKQRIELYNRLNAASATDELLELAMEIKDRFGPIPEETEKLIATLRVKALASAMKVEKMDMTGSRMFLVFNPSTTITPERLVAASQTLGNKFRFVSENMVEFGLNGEGWRVRFTSLVKFLEFLLE